MAVVFKLRGASESVGGFMNPNCQNEVWKLFDLKNELANTSPGTIKKFTVFLSNAFED